MRKPRYIATHTEDLTIEELSLAPPPEEYL